jgi:CHAD domain-containing protein
MPAVKHFERHPAVDLMSRHLSQIANGYACTLDCDDPEGPHSLRVGLRRLRAGLWFFRPVLDAEIAEPLTREARWLGQEVGPLRDLEVLWHATIHPRHIARPDDPGLAALDRILITRIENNRPEIRNLLRSDRVIAFFGSSAALRNNGAWALPDGGADALEDLSRVALNRRMSKSRKLGDRFKHLDTPSRHDFRKRLKKLRYCAESAHDLHGYKRTRNFIAQVKKLQRLLGLMNDAAMAELILTEVTADLQPDAPARCAAQALIRERAAKAVIDGKKVQKMWLRLADHKPL